MGLGRVLLRRHKEWCVGLLNGFLVHFTEGLVRFHVLNQVHAFVVFYNEGGWYEFVKLQIGCRLIACG